MTSVTLKGQSLKSWEKWIHEEMGMIRAGQKASVYDPHQGEANYEYLLGAFREAITKLRDHERS